MKRFSILLVSVTAVIGAAVALLALGAGASSEAAGPPGGPQVVSAFGLGSLRGEDAVVHVTVVVPGGQSARATVEAALAAQNARPVGSAFSLTGVVWPQFGDDGNPNNDFVTQYYNPANDPTAGGAGALLAGHTEWGAVTTSTFAFAYGGETSRCPSTVAECGSQVRDSFNDVAWMPLKDRNTLGVTWSWMAEPYEADMAMNTNFQWTADAGAEGRIDGCKGPSRNCYVFDAETVFLHENGHVPGLGHSAVTGAVMEAAYAGVRRALHQDDMDGITALYPDPDFVPPPDPDPTPSGDITVTSPNGAAGYWTEGGKSSDLHLNIDVTVEDGGGALSGATVSIDLYRDGVFVGRGTATTGGGGTVTFGDYIR